MDSAILLVDHGSKRQAANDLLADIAALVRREAPDIHVAIAHMELARPTVEKGFDACVAAGARSVTVCPYLLVPGRHAEDDIPRLAEAAARRHAGVRWTVAAPIGLHPLLAPIVLDRAREAEVRAWR